MYKKELIKFTFSTVHMWHTVGHSYFEGRKFRGFLDFHKICFTEN